MTKPISPDEIGALKRAHFPPAVFEVVNELIAENFTDGRAKIKQDDIIERLLPRLPEETTRRDIFDRGLLNFEEAYREEGWSVKYDKPAYNEDYDAFFVFKAK